MPIHNIYKPLGWSSLDVITEFQKRFPEYIEVPMTFAGRLDPMAEGVMILLSGEDRYSKDEFQNLDKTYKAEFLFGFTSDTYDCLGLVERSGVVPNINEEQVSDRLMGLHKLEFPPYSSYRVKGKPLHHWANEGKLDEIDIPIKKMSVMKISDVEIYKDRIENVRGDVLDRIIKVRGNFRQDKIIKRWNKLTTDNDLTLAQCTIEVTSGTYIRALAHKMGQNYGCGAVLYSLKRTTVGNHKVEDSLRIS
ncbi:hypothetical protein HON52_00700 [Candidatus Uhrbacteria bacterium]|jgi:tRNA pseudouridine55 synthase|nr:hypothetical protein [Candidatus Uhrbacteria bacterium]